MPHKIQLVERNPDEGYWLFEPELEKLIIETCEKAKEHFGQNVNFYLEADSDPEIYPVYTGEVVLAIAYPIGSYADHKEMVLLLDRAIEARDKFDNNWWLANSDRANRRLLLDFIPT